MSLIPRGEGLPRICIVSARCQENPRGLCTRGWRRLWMWVEDKGEGCGTTVAAAHYTNILRSGVAISTFVCSARLMPTAAV